MTSQHQYHLNSEYRNREMNRAENVRLVQVAHTATSDNSRNVLAIIVNKVQSILRHEQAEATPDAIVNTQNRIPSNS